MTFIQRAPKKAIYGNVVRHGLSGSFQTIEIGTNPKAHLQYHISGQ